ncbi:MAG TPA: cytochrome C [Paucimonas sp.]|nr:cytochrome C [Paucimonas sp.]
MKSSMRRFQIAATCVTAAAAVMVAPTLLAQAVPPPQLRTPVPVPNGSGSALTVTTTGTIDTANPFFKPFGNGRTCASCHSEREGWSITPQGVQARFAASNGTDPVFRLVDGANSPNLRDTTIDQKRVAYSMLLTKGLIRVGLPVPAAAEFDLLAADDPYGYANVGELSLFRRPLPATNLRFLSTVMWDMRETFTDADSNICLANTTPAKCFSSIDFDLLHQADSAVKGHAQAAAGLTAAEQRAIVDFEKSLTTAQATDNRAGSLSALNARGGPAFLATQPFYFGINDVTAGDYRTGAAFSQNVMTMFGPWRTQQAQQQGPQRRNGAQQQAAGADAEARAAIARGEGIFNNKPFDIRGVAGFNGEIKPALFRGTCASCHDAPNAGSHSVTRMFNIGTAAAARRTPDLPLYTLRNKTTGETVQTSDPALALQTGKWADIGRVKVPTLRALAARPPYFHNGSAADVGDVVRFYDQRFNIRFTPQDAADLTAFLRAL